MVKTIAYKEQSINNKQETPKLIAFVVPNGILLKHVHNIIILAGSAPQSTLIYIILLQCVLKISCSVVLTHLFNLQMF